jgi:hypothetical protein
MIKKLSPVIAPCHQLPSIAISCHNEYLNHPNIGAGRVAAKAMGAAVETELYRQQQEMHDTKKCRIDDRIANLSKHTYAP